MANENSFRPNPQNWPYGQAPQAPASQGQAPKPQPIQGQNPQGQPPSGQGPQSPPSYAPPYYPQYAPGPSQPYSGPAAGPLYPTLGGMPTSPQQVLPPTMETSYIENILRLNRERVATVYMTFEHQGGGESKVFRGEIEAAGRDHVIINDNKTGTRYLLPLVYLDYVTFQGPINYFYPYR
ncbi:spore coat protein GerQ [Caenibacillus caldisaponilyticus]|uniref:spore coat protein GerQ n=1 Tax=Caenibacillus caldisaponilyticus TaxID=1674942 RepID=UPI001EE73C6D|nr:spore coat protein GerQ [Caenibacillus caldisaponilyticus]